MGKRKRKTKVPPLALALGREIRAIRNERGWSIATLADLTDQDRCNVSAHERGLMLPSLPTIESYASAFGVFTSTLVSRAESGVRYAS